MVEINNSSIGDSVNQKNFDSSTEDISIFFN